MKPWEAKNYKKRLANEWFALGMLNPAKYSKYDDWVDALTKERQIKDYIYDKRFIDAEANKLYDARNGIDKYKPGYIPLDWDELQAEALTKFKKPILHYMYSPLSTPNIDKYYFDFKEADQWCEFIEQFICHVEGDLGNSMVLLSLEQRSFFRTIFGWKHKETNLRRYTEIFKYIPRKNSKTFDLAALAIGVMIIDNEAGCKIVAVATCLDQAKHAFKPAYDIIKKDKELRVCNGELSKYFEVYKESITANFDADVFKPIAFKEASAHGGNFHVSILDEVHEMVDDTMYDVCDTSQGARSQPLIIMITTAATAEENFCNRKLKYSKDVCNMPDYDDDFLPILYYANPEEFDDDWHDTNVHIRVNPMYGLGKKERYMNKQHNKAVKQPHAENSFKRLHLNWITASVVSAFNGVSFNKCTKRLRLPETKKILKQEVPRFLFGERCYAGVDLASKNDLCALTLDFPGSNWVISWSFTPEKNRKIKDIERFANKLNFCGEEIIDFGELRGYFKKILKNFDVVQLGFDPAFATELIQKLDKKMNIDFFEINQTAKFLNEPTRAAIDDVQGEKIQHNGCLLFSWQISNCNVKEDSQERIMLQKTGSRSNRKIDAAAAWINARALRLANDDDASLEQRFEETGSYF